MLYLFGRLALSDSLDYHENYHDDDFRPATHSERSSPPEPDHRSTADRQLLRASRLSQADRASTGCPSK